MQRYGWTMATKIINVVFDHALIHVNQGIWSLDFKHFILKQEC